MAVGRGALLQGGLDPEPALAPGGDQALRGVGVEAHLAEERELALDGLVAGHGHQAGARLALVDGDHAAAEGALAAGCRFFGGIKPVAVIVCDPDGAFALGIEEGFGDIDSLLEKAIRQRASHIHIETNPEMFHLRLRIEGILKTVFQWRRLWLGWKRRTWEKTMPGW